MAPPLTPEEIAQMMQFIAKKTKNVASPMNISELCRQFKEETGSLLTLQAFTARINKNRHKIHGMDEFDMETKVKMMFALSAPIAGGFLNELRKHAEAEVDDKQRIIRFKKIGGGLELKGRHAMSPSMSAEEIAPLMQFIANKAKIYKYPLNIQELCRQFKEETGSVVLESCLRARIQSNRDRIHEMSEFDMDTKVEMMFALSAPIDKGFLIELRKHAEVEVDDKQRIIRFKKTGGGLELNQRHLMLQILLEKAKTVMTPIGDISFVKEYKATTGDIRSQHALLKIYEKVKRTIFELPGIEKDIKVKMMFISSAELPGEILEELRTDAYVEVDRHGRIRKYEAIDGSLIFEGDHGWYVAMKGAKTDYKRQSIEAISRGIKRAREDFDTYNAEDFDYDPLYYEKDKDQVPVEKKPKSLVEVKTEEPSTSGYRYEDNFFDYDTPNYVENMKHIPVEEKPEDLLEIKIEAPEEPSTSNVE